MLLLFGSSYRVDLSASPTASNFFSYNVVSRDGGTSSLMLQDNFTIVAGLPSPQGAELLFTQASLSQYLKRIQVRVVNVLNVEGVNWEGKIRNP